MKTINRPRRFFSRRSCGVRLRLLTSFSVVVLAAIVNCWPVPVTTAQQSIAKGLVRHGFTVDGRIEGSVQQLAGEDTTINGGATITGRLLTPGTPTINQDEGSILGEVTEGTGSEQGAAYSITLNGAAQLGGLVKRTPAATTSSVPAPPAAAGTRDVILGDAEHDPGDFATLRDLTLNGGGLIPVPAGTYRGFVANGEGGFVLGVAGSSQPTVYNLDSLTLNDGGNLKIVGPVVLVVANTVTLSGPAGSADHASWLDLKVASGNVTINGGGAFFGVLTAPSSTVTINSAGSLTGNFTCDRLSVNAGALVRIID
jgi:hypothetical protein